MDQLDLLSIREDFNNKDILLCFNGPISRSLIEELGNAIKQYLHEDDVTPSISMDVFSIYIELTQNIRHYSQRQGYSEIQGSATVVIGRCPDLPSSYRILAGNVIEREDGAAMKRQVEDLARMDKSELKRAYRQQLRQPRDREADSGAGLGLLAVARRTTQPISCHLVDTADGKAFFSLLAIV